MNNLLGGFQNLLMLPQQGMDNGMQIGDDQALNNVQMHQRLRQLLAMMSMQPQQQNQLTMPNASQYPAMQLQMPQQQPMNPLMLAAMLQGNNSLMR